MPATGSRLRGESHAAHCVLLQVYGPHPENDNAFHRTVFLFVTPQARCA